MGKLEDPESGKCFLNKTLTAQAIRTNKIADSGAQAPLPHHRHPPTAHLPTSPQKPPLSITSPLQAPTPRVPTMFSAPVTWVHLLGRASKPGVSHLPSRTALKLTRHKSLKHYETFFITFFF